MFQEKFFHIFKIHPLESTTLYEDHTAVPGLYLDTFWLSNDILQLLTEFSSLKESVDNSMVPTVDNNIIRLVVAILSAFTICIVFCQLIIFYFLLIFSDGLALGHFP